MARDTLSERVERLELTVQGLEGLPGEVAGLRRDAASLGDRMMGVETQILQLRTEIRGEISAVCSEMRTGFAEVRGEMQAGFSELAEKIDESWHRTLALHEHVIAQIKTIGEHGDAKAPGRKPRASRRKR